MKNLRKSFLLFIVLTFTTLSIQSAQAYQADVSSNSEDGQYTVQLSAQTELEDANAVSIDLIAENLEVVDYVAPDDSNWLAILGTCDDEQMYTSTNVCVSLAKSDAIEAGENLGVITVEVLNQEYGAQLDPTSDNSYSNGQDSANIDEPLIVLDKPLEIEAASETVANDELVEGYEAPEQEFSLSTEDMTLIFLVLVAAILLIIFIAAFLANKKKPSTLTKAGMVITLVLLIIDLVVLAGIAFTNSNQSSQSSSDSTFTSGGFASINNCNASFKDDFDKPISDENWLNQADSPNTINVRNGKAVFSHKQGANSTLKYKLPAESTTGDVVIKWKVDFNKDSLPSDEDLKNKLYFETALSSDERYNFHSIRPTDNNALRVEAGGVVYPSEENNWKNRARHLTVLDYNQPIDFMYVRTGGKIQSYFKTVNMQNYLMLVEHDFSPDQEIENLRMTLAVGGDKNFKDNFSISQPVIVEVDSFELGCELPDNIVQSNYATGTCQQLGTTDNFDNNAFDYADFSLYNGIAREQNGRLQFNIPDDAPWGPVRSNYKVIGDYRAEIDIIPDNNSREVSGRLAFTDASTLSSSLAISVDSSGKQRLYASNWLNKESVNGKGIEIGRIRPVRVAIEKKDSKISFLYSLDNGESYRFITSYQSTRYDEPMIVEMWARETMKDGQPQAIAFDNFSLTCATGEGLGNLQEMPRRDDFSNFDDTAWNTVIDDDDGSYRISDQKLELIRNNSQGHTRLFSNSKLAGDAIVEVDLDLPDGEQTNDYEGRIGLFGDSQDIVIRAARVGNSLRIGVIHNADQAEPKPVNLGERSKVTMAIRKTGDRYQAYYRDPSNNSYVEMANVRLSGAEKSIGLINFRRDAGKGGQVRAVFDNLNIISKNYMDNAVNCGPLDSNSDNRVNGVDFAAFAQVWHKTCKDFPTTDSACGIKDAGGSNRFIGLPDFANFARSFGQQSCEN